MKKILIISAIALAAIVSCKQQSSEDKVMARFVPERMDDFIWENDYICYRAYGQALEGNPTSPGFDVWVKTPGELVANERYRLELEDSLSYHIDRGNGKDCYKVAVSLGAGASSPLVDGQLAYPPTNFRSWEILESSAEKVVFVLHYPAWDVDGKQVSLDKKITVTAGTYFCQAEDTYNGDFDSLIIAAGLFRHEIESEMQEVDRFAIWEKASDTTFEPEDGMLGLGVYMPGAEDIVTFTSGDKPHTVALKTVKPGESLSYYFGSCWTKGDIKTAEDWFRMVSELQ